MADRGVGKTARNRIVQVPGTKHTFPSYEQTPSVYHRLRENGRKCKTGSFLLSVWATTPMHRMVSRHCELRDGH